MQNSFSGAVRHGESRLLLDLERQLQQEVKIQHHNDASTASCTSYALFLVAVARQEKFIGLARRVVPAHLPIADHGIQNRRSDIALTTVIFILLRGLQRLPDRCTDLQRRIESSRRKA